MNVKFLNPFVLSAHEILRLEMRETAERGELHLETGSYRTDDVTVIISLIGAVDGAVFYSMSNETAIRFASALMRERLDAFDELAQSGIAELGNVITGQASMRLSDAGYESNISTPSLILGRGALISTLEFPRLVVPLSTSIGVLTIHLSLKENPHTALKTPQITPPKTFDV